MTDLSSAVFDFVIVGAGSAGCVMADRLSEDGRFSVCVIEAGGSDRRFYVQMPLGYGKTFYDPAVNWGYRTEPDPGLAGQRDYWPRGKLLGGSSSINAMVWIRGDRRDYDDWAKEGNVGWGFDDVLPFFKSLEASHIGDDRLRGRSGKLHLDTVTARLHPLAHRFVEAGKQAGLAHNPDFNGDSQLGVGSYEFNIKGGWRQSAAKAFLKPAMARRNVMVLTRAHACRIVIEEGRAAGVEIDRRGQRDVVRARREVIVSGGAVNSPQLLHHSGIGPDHLLYDLGIPIRFANANVGHHLQDHIGINYTFKAKVPTLNQILRPWWGKMLVGMDFLLRGRGPLSLSLNHGGGFIKTRPGLDRANIQLYFQAISTLIPKEGERPLLTPDPFPGFSIGLSSCKTSSRGSILAQSPDPFTAPRITANAFATSEDVQDYLEGVKYLRVLAKQPALAEVTEEELRPGPAIQSDEDIIADFRRRSGTVYHPCGTCRMGSDPATSVVDPRLKVHGIKGLRVADASVFPAVMSGNTNAPTMMVGAKAAAMILEDAC